MIRFAKGTIQPGQQYPPRGGVSLCRRPERSPKDEATSVFPPTSHFSSSEDGLTATKPLPFAIYAISSSEDNDPETLARYRTKDLVEYQTPPQTEGLGTRSRLLKNTDPIRGVAMLVGLVKEGESQPSLPRRTPSL